MAENRYIREKLEKVLEIMPNHLSSKILLIYGAGKKPFTLESKFYASLMQKLLSPLNDALTDNHSSLKKYYADRYRENIVKDIEIYRDTISNEDKIVFDNIENICQLLRKLSAGYSRKSYAKLLRELETLNAKVQNELALRNGVVLLKDE